MFVSLPARKMQKSLHKIPSSKPSGTYLHSKRKATFRRGYTASLTILQFRPYERNDTLLANISDEQIDDTLNDESEEQIAKLNKAMKKLDADERAVITLFYMEDKPVSEIALILGMTESNTKVKLHRIRKKLYVLITNEKL